MIDNRAISSIKTGLDKGENLYIYHGEYIHDWFLYDLYNGVMTLKEAFQRFFLVDQSFSYFVYFRNNIFEVYKLVNDRVVITKELTEGHISNDDPLNGLNSTQGSNSSGNEGQRQAGQAAESEAEPDKAALMKVVEYCKNNPSSRIAFFFEDFEWTTGLYKSSNDGELVFIEKVLEIANNNNCVVIISISNAEMLSRYNFNINGKNVEMLGSPSVDEIWRSYIRSYFRRYKKKRKVTQKDFLELTLISEAIGAGDKSLKEAMRIFDRVMVNSKGIISKDDFESALEKHIEEKVSLEDVVMAEDTKSKIVEPIDKFLQSDDVSSLTKGMILTGPPGTGKTFIVKALANEKNCYFMSPSLADLKGEYVGQTSGKVKRIFQQARANAPTIMFIDEADTVFPLRDMGSGDSDSFTKDMVNQFLVEMDGLTTGNSKVFVIAATNRVNILDNAIKSRLGTPIDIPLPDKEQRKQLFSNHLRKEDVDSFCKFYFFDEFIDKTNRMSGRDIKNFVTSLSTEAMKRTRRLTDYTQEEETRTLFFTVLHDYEEKLIGDLIDKLHVTIKRPKDCLNYNSIIGCDGVKNAIARQLRMFDPAQRQRARDYNIAPRRGILLYGPPGNGKSQLAEAASNHHNLLFMKITSDTFTKTTLSEQSQTLLKIFSSAIQLSELCSEQAGVLLFFDEFDSLVSTDLLDSRIRGTMLTQLDDTNTMRNPATKVLFVAATNYYDQLDEAVIRAGRIDEKIEMNNPSRAEAKKMIVQFCRQNPAVQVPTEDEAGDIYSRYVTALEDKIIEAQYSRSIKHFLAEGKTGEILTDILNAEVKGAVHPSGASIKNFINRLIENAYDNDSINEESKQLVISRDIIDMTCKTVMETEV